MQERTEIMTSDPRTRLLLIAGIGLGSDSGFPKHAGSRADTHGETIIPLLRESPRIWPMPRDGGHSRRQPRHDGVELLGLLIQLHAENPQFFDIRTDESSHVIPLSGGEPGQLCDPAAVIAYCEVCSCAVALVRAS
jgi:hypothetical protein